MKQNLHQCFPINIYLYAFFLQFLLVLMIAGAQVTKSLSTCTPLVLGLSPSENSLDKRYSEALLCYRRGLPLAPTASDQSLKCFSVRGDNNVEK